MKANRSMTRKQPIKHSMYRNDSTLEPQETAAQYHVQTRALPIASDPLSASVFLHKEKQPRGRPRPARPSSHRFGRHLARPTVMTNWRSINHCIDNGQIGATRLCIIHARERFHSILHVDKRSNPLACVDAHMY